jgi:antitoxin (DNA-binding transcriptional repressor) of toxin-antitoxin stability system
MTTVNIGQADLNNCISASQIEPVVLTRKGDPVALIVGIDGLDQEQVALGASTEFWKLIQERRKEPTLSRQELNERIASNE